MKETPNHEKPLAERIDSGDLKNKSLTEIKDILSGEQKTGLIKLLKAVLGFIFCAAHVIFVLWLWVHVFIFDDNIISQVLLSICIAMELTQLLIRFFTKGKWFADY